MPIKHFTVEGSSRYSSHAPWGWARSLPLVMAALGIPMHQAAAQDEATVSKKYAVRELAVDLGIGYAVRAVDINGDGKQDIAVVDKDRLLWFENPGWERHIILQGTTKPDNVCFAPLDIDEDGKLDFAVGADWTLNTATGGTIQWLRQTESGPWEWYAIDEEPTVHRMQWVNVDEDSSPELVVLPLLGRGTTSPHFAESGVRILAYDRPASPKTERWTRRVLNEDLHVTHNFAAVELDQDSRAELVVASFEGLSWLRPGPTAWSLTRIGVGNQQTSPNRGASEVQQGKLADGTPYLATIEPWHGGQVVVYFPPAAGPASGDLWQRQVLDETLKWGHAVKCADLDGDKDDELIIGVRDNFSAQAPCGVRIYDPQAMEREPTARRWEREMLDPGGVAVEDMAVADLDADGDLEIIAVGRATHNLRVYTRQEP